MSSVHTISTRQTMRRQACGITTLPSRQSRYSMWSAAVARRFMPCLSATQDADEKQKKLDSLPPKSRNVFKGDKELIDSLRSQAADYQKQAEEWMLPEGD